MGLIVTPSCCCSSVVVRDQKVIAQFYVLCYRCALCWVSEFLQSLMIFMLYYCEREAISEANIKWQLHSIQKCCCFYSSWIYLLKMSIIHARRHHNHYHIRLTAAIAASHVFSLNNNCIAWLMRQNSFHFLDFELQQRSA